MARAGVNQTLSCALALLLLSYTLWTKSGDRPDFNCRQNFACTGLVYCPFCWWFGDVDTSAAGSTEAGGLSRALPTYDPRDTLAWLCQKHRSCRPDQPSLCSGCHRQETKLTVRPCGETRWPHASQPRIITGRSSKNWPPLWSWLAATARTPAPFMDPADRRWYALQHSCWMV